MKKKYILTGIKYAASLCLIIGEYVKVGKPQYVWGGIFELLVIFFLSDLLIRWKKHIGRIVNDVLILLFNVQQLVLMFGMTFISTVMLENIGSIEDLKGRAVEYITAGLLCLFASCLPVVPIPLKQENEMKIFSSALAGELVFTMVCGSGYSPLYGYVELGIEEKAKADAEAYIRSQPNVTGKFYQDGVTDMIQKPDNLPEKPNVVLIFTEGLSQSIVEDERGIMPNVAAYEKQSVSFTNYYNHTAATYRGLIGQLYSGYQYNNYDTNTLISIEEIMKNEGYKTTFINTEPNNTRFTSYLEDLNFDLLIQPDVEDYLSDKKAYEELFKTMEDDAKDSQPFFTAIYTFGTHASLDSRDEKFGDGSNPELNKFYDCDYQFGKFIEKFNKSDLADNTIIVFTSDHCTYCDDSFKESFPDYERPQQFVDRIPLLMYYKGVTPQEFDAAGRNTLSLAPTILDYLDISEPNYFLGDPLFNGGDNVNNDLDTVFTISGTEFVSTERNSIHALDPTVSEIVEERYHDYLAAKEQGRMQ